MNDIRWMKTEQLIQDTLKDMILEMPFREITVKGLRERAGIYRKTFHLHYETLVNLLVQISLLGLNEYIEP